MNIRCLSVLEKRSNLEDCFGYQVFSQALSCLSPSSLSSQKPVVFVSIKP
jgi:hypothetical protein